MKKLNKYGEGIRHIAKEEEGLTIGVIKYPKTISDDLSCNFTRSEYLFLDSIAYRLGLLDNNVIKVIAKLDERDEFNKETGFDIVDLKLEAKFCDRMTRHYQSLIVSLMNIISNLYKKKQFYMEKKEKALENLKKYN